MNRLRRHRWITVSAVAALTAAGATAAVSLAQSDSEPGVAPPERAGVHFPGAAGTYDLPAAALNGVSPENYSTLAEADGIIAAGQQRTAPGERCVVIATASGAVTRGCWEGDLKPGTLVWAFDEGDGSQSVAFATDGRAADARVGQRTSRVAAGSDIAVTRLQKGESLPIHVQQGTAGYAVSFPGGTATR